ncbi:MAG TPA: hypothetical protein VN325_39845 [Steroidobacteraceae bacterium]|nr:hypothetical protein [Steroidobacteraceae bacterium]
MSADMLVPDVDERLLEQASLAEGVFIVKASRLLQAIRLHNHETSNVFIVVVVHQWAGQDELYDTRRKIGTMSRAVFVAKRPDARLVKAEADKKHVQSPMLSAQFMVSSIGKKGLRARSSSSGIE